MIKYFCNKCGRELKKGDHDRVRRKLGSFKVEIMIAVNDVWNAGELCHKCIIKIVNEGKRFRSR